MAVAPISTYSNPESSNARSTRRISSRSTEREYQASSGRAIGVRPGACAAARRTSAFASGTFTAVAVVSGLLGICLLPFSLVGIFFLGLGLLGLSPFLVAAVYLRAARAALPIERTSSQELLVVGGLALVLGVSAATQVTAWHTLEKSLTEIASGEPLLARQGTRRLSIWSPDLDLDGMVTAYELEPDPARQARIAVAYQQLTGESVADRLAVLRD
jgi:hypothetical protein